ncbi:hypothetical protein D3C76_736670 [compost metagenome]
MQRDEWGLPKRQVIDWFKQSVDKGLMQKVATLFASSSLKAQGLKVSLLQSQPMNLPGSLGLASVNF